VETDSQGNGSHWLRVEACLVDPGSRHSSQKAGHSITCWLKVEQSHLGELDNLRFTAIWSCPAKGPRRAFDGSPPPAAIQ